MAQWYFYTAFQGIPLVTNPLSISLNRTSTPSHNSIALIGGHSRPYRPTRVFFYYLKEIYPSQVTVEKADKSDHLANYHDLTFNIDSGGKLSTSLYDKCSDFDSHCQFSIPFQQYTICPFLWCIHFTAHKICTKLLTMISDIGRSTWLIDFCHKAM